VKVAAPTRSSSTGWSDRLAAEASAQHRHDRRPVREDFVGYDAHGRLRTGRFISYAPAGDLLDRLHRTEGHALAEEHLGGDLIPTRCAYLFYGPDDFIGPHQDVVQCDYTVMVPLTPGRLLTYPEGVVGTPRELLDRFLTNRLPEQSCIEYEPGMAYTVPGGSMVHARRAESALEAIVALCYSPAQSLWPPELTAWSQNQRHPGPDPLL
jgi:hypothetical protein